MVQLGFRQRHGVIAVFLPSILRFRDRVGLLLVLIASCQVH